MSQCYAHIPTPSGKRRCPATASTYRAGVPVCTAHGEPKAVAK